MSVIAKRSVHSNIWWKRQDSHDRIIDTKAVCILGVWVVLI